MSGIDNIGNTCFAGAVIQVLRYCTPVVKRDLASNDPLLRAFYDTLYDVDVPDKETTFLKKLPELGYQKHDQQDAHEFLMKMIDRMFTHGDDPFEGEMTSILECDNAHSSITTYPFYSLLVFGDVREGLIAYGEPEHVDMKCEKCGKPMTKRMTVTTGDVLVLQLARFDGQQKLNHEVSIPHIIKNNKMMYLCGVIHHTGSVNNGHYTASVFTKSGWKHVNDEFVQPCERPFRSRTAYVLIYISKEIP